MKTNGLKKYLLVASTPSKEPETGVKFMVFLQKSYFYMLFALTLLVGCEKSGEINVDDLNAEKSDFLSRVFEGELQDGPFFLNYWLSTVFFSQDIISVFGEFTRYTHFPHESKRYEGKTFVKINGVFRPISFNDLFASAEQKEFVRKYCENILKEGAIGYFAEDSFRDQLDLGEIQTFLIHENFFVIIFQRYAIAGLEDYPTTIRIPYTILRDHINSNISLIPTLERTVASASFISSWKDVWGEESGAIAVQ